MPQLSVMWKLGLGGEEVRAKAASTDSERGGGQLRLGRGGTAGWWLGFSFCLLGRGGWGGVCGACKGLKLFARGFKTIDEAEEERVFENVEMGVKTGKYEHNAHGDDYGRGKNCHGGGISLTAEGKWRPSRRQIGMSEEGAVRAEVSGGGRRVRTGSNAARGWHTDGK